MIHSLQLCLRSGKDRIKNLPVCMGRRDRLVAGDWLYLYAVRAKRCSSFSTQVPRDRVSNSLRDKIGSRPTSPTSPSSYQPSSSSRPSSSCSSKTNGEAPGMDSSAPVPPPSAAAVESAKDLHNKLRTASPALAEDFDTKYDAWRETWFGNNDSPNSDTRATGPEFAALVALGPKIIPFVVYRLTSGEDVMAVVLCMAHTQHPRTYSTSS